MVFVLKHTLNRRIISFILALMMIICFAGCAADGQDTAPTETTDTEATSFVMDAEYVIVRSNEARNSANIGKSVEYIKEALKSACGLNTTIDSDTAPISEDRYEIILGETVREETKALKEGLTASDYAYEIKSEKKIIICGGTNAATFEATKKFCADILGYDGTKPKVVQKKTIQIGTYEFKATYEYDSLKVNEIDIKDFVVAYATPSDVDYAESLQSVLGTYTGDIVTMKKFSELSGDEKAVVCINAMERDGVQDKTLNLSLSGYVAFAPKMNGALLTCPIVASSGEYYGDAIKAMFEKAENSLDGRNAALTLSNERIIEYEMRYAIPTWTLKSTSGVKRVADGVNYTMYQYEDEQGLPYRVSVMTIDPTKAYLYMGTSSDSYECIPSTKGTVKDHIDAAVANGVKVVGGVNGDYFAISGNYQPHGLAIKEGKVINIGGTPFCGFTNDGQMVIGESGSSFDYSTLRTAVGGSHIIVKDGLPYKLAMDQEHGNTSHPRTLAGYRSDGTIILAVIDGRVPTISNGASLAECARFMLSLGAECAINLDGGGSSTMMIKSGGVFVKKSFYGSRRVYSSLLVVSKSDE